jgi:hypothetical protein
LDTHYVSKALNLQTTIKAKKVWSSSFINKVLVFQFFLMMCSNNRSSFHNCFLAVVRVGSHYHSPIIAATISSSATMTTTSFHMLPLQVLHIKLQCLHELVRKNIMRSIVVATLFSFTSLTICRPQDLPLQLVTKQSLMISTCIGHGCSLRQKNGGGYSYPNAMFVK